MLQTITKHLKRFRHAKRGLSNVIVVMLSLVILVVISANVILWSYQMNQLDWEKMQENISITNVERIDGARFSFKNEGPLTSHLISLWVNNATNHQRYDINLLVNSGENTIYTRADISLPTENFVVKVVTERGNIAVFARH